MQKYFILLFTVFSMQTFHATTNLSGWTIHALIWWKVPILIGITVYMYLLITHVRIVYFSPLLHVGYTMVRVGTMGLGVWRMKCTWVWVSGVWNVHGFGCLVHETQLNKATDPIKRPTIQLHHKPSRASGYNIHGVNRQYVYNNLFQCKTFVV